MLFKSMDACTDSIIFKVIASNKEKANAVAGSCYVARPAILATRIRLNIISAREERKRNHSRDEDDPSGR